MLVEDPVETEKRLAREKIVREAAAKKAAEDAVAAAVAKHMAGLISKANADAAKIAADAAAA